MPPKPPPVVVGRVVTLPRNEFNSKLCNDYYEGQSKTAPIHLFVREYVHNRAKKCRKWECSILEFEDEVTTKHVPRVNTPLEEYSETEGVKSKFSFLYVTVFVFFFFLVFT